MNKTSNKTAKTAKSTKDTNSMKKSATTKDTSVTAKNTKSDHKVISDYNGYNYKKVFWEDSGREYEDLADRTAIRRLLPKNMDNFVDICGGYGRLANEYLPRAKRATLFDYSKLNLEQAREEFGDKLHTVQGDIYKTPFSDGEFSALLMVRATHHFENLEQVLRELNRILETGGVAVIEVANKRTLPKMLRYWFKRSSVNPFDKQPSNLKEIDKDGFYNYHPAYVEDLFKKTGFEIMDVLSVSNFRSRTMKKIFSTKALIKLEKAVQGPLASVRFAPSIYYRLIKTK